MKKLSKSPLIMVLAQVKFAPVLRIDKFVPDIQEELRAKLPHFVEEQVQEFVLNLAAGNVPPVRTSRRWIFGSANWRNTMVLAEDFVAIETSAYDNFEVFAGQFSNVLELLQKKIGLSRSERLGLRYVDLIRGEGTKPSNIFIRKELRGLSSASLKDIKSIQSTSISQTTTPLGGRLMIRIVHTDDGTFIPPELASTKLQFSNPTKAGEAVSILDIDHNGEFPSDFDVAAIIKRLGELHDYTEEAFIKAVTPEAVKAWS
jgi:uncharacterized protein (TIGR04255 family)